SVMGVGLLLDILKSVYDEQYIYQLTHADERTLHAKGWTGFFAILLLSISTGIVEELLARGYLIPRLEQLFRSCWLSVLISSLVFGIFHLRGGNYLGMACVSYRHRVWNYV